MLGAFYKFTQFINCTAHLLNLEQFRVRLRARVRVRTRNRVRVGQRDSAAQFRMHSTVLECATQCINSTDSQNAPNIY